MGWNIAKIPKIAHFYWGATKLSWLRYMTVKTFSVCNPDWKIKFYIPSKLFSGGLKWEQERVSINIDYLPEIYKLPNTEVITLDFDVLGIGDIPEVFRSDVLRLKLLGSDGGFWADMDVITFKPFNEAYFNNPVYNKVDTFISYTYERNHYSIGYLLASVNNEFYNFLYNKSMQCLLNSGDRQTFGVILWDRYFKRPEDIHNYFPDLKLFNIGLEASYYFIYTQLPEMFEQNNVIKNNNSIALHWYGGHPISNKWESALDQSNWNLYENTITSLIKKALSHAN